MLRIRDVYPGCEFFSIPDPNFPSRIHIKEFKYFNPKNCFQSLGNMIRDVHFLPDPVSWGQKYIGSQFRIRNTACTGGIFFIVISPRAVAEIVPVLVQAGVPGNVHCAADDGAGQQQSQALACHQAARSQHLQGPGTYSLIQFCLI